MKNKALLNEIAKNTTIIDYHLKRLNNKPENLHDLDIDLLSEKLKEIYNLVLELEPGAKPISQPEPVLSLPKNTPSPEPEAVIEPEPEPEVKAEVEPGPVPPPPSPESESVIEPEPEPEVKAEVEPGPVPGPPSPEPESVIEPEPEPEVKAEVEPNPVSRPLSTEPNKTTADLFSGPTTIGESFQAEKDNSIAATVNPSPVGDLKMAIGINDKFLFINELFKGDPTIYDEAIEKFNSTALSVDAENQMDVYRQQYDWADNSEAYHRLNKIVKSKFNS